MKLNSLEELFVYLLSDIYRIEHQITQGIPGMVKKAYSDDLKKALNDHLGETKEQIVRLDKIFKMIDKTPTDVIWSGDIKNLFSDIETLLLENTTSPVLDAAIIAICQRIEHVEIATYGTLCEFANALHYFNVEDLLKDTIKEEGHADKLLTKLAAGGAFTHGINAEANRH